MVKFGSILLVSGSSLFHLKRWN